MAGIGGREAKAVLLTVGLHPDSWGESIEDVVSREVSEGEVNVQTCGWDANETLGLDAAEDVCARRSGLD